MVADSSKKEGVSREQKAAGMKKKTQHGSSSSSSGGVKREPGVKKTVKSEDGAEALPKEKRKPGQKYATPTPGQADRVFYETLLEQKPDSHMAQDWCLAYGVCGASDAETLYKLTCKRKGVQPSKNAPPLSSSPVKKAKRPSSGGGGGRPRSSLPKDVEADTGFEPSNVFEGVGATGF